MREETKYRKFCDMCGEEILISLSCCKAKCSICSRDLCEKCIGHEDPTWGDYRIVFCGDCWDIGKQYREEIEILESKVEQLNDNWHKECEKFKIKK